MQEVVLFGGAFDPPHQGHFTMVNNLLADGRFAQVWYVPAGKHDFAKNMVDAKQRVKMLKLMIEQHFSQGVVRERVRLELCELERSGISHSYQTLQQLSQHYPQYRFSWLIGADNLAKFHLWKNYQQMLTEFLFYVYPRPGFAMQPVYNGMIPLTGVETVPAASTEIRAKIKKGQGFSQFLIKQVAKYIDKKGLYGSC